MGLFLFGALAFPFLPVATLPEVEYPTITVSAALPGASPETMATAVATPLERMFGRIAGITQMTSLSQLGSTSITMQFDLDRNVDAAGRDVQAAINAARGQLPVNLPTNPSWRKVNPAEIDIVTIALTSDTATTPQLYDVADSILAQKISQIPGVAQVTVGGSSRPGVRVEFNPFLLSKLGLGLEQVRKALADANADVPKGALSGANRMFLLNSNDQLFLAKNYAQLIVAYRNGAPVRLSDVATVIDSQEDIRNAGFVNGKPAVLVQLYRQPQANIIDVTQRAEALMPMLQASIPPSIHLDITEERVMMIRGSVRDVELTLIVSVILVILVVFLFLGNVWATAIPSMVVPLSLVGTFGVMYLLGYSVDNLSLMALAISTGFVVDDAIVVIENISRYLEQGLSSYEAAFRGAREIGFTVISMSTSLIAVFIPILLMGGIVGRIFREFAVTLSVAVTLSLIISLTVTPAMCAKFLKAEKDLKPNRLARASGRGFQWLCDGYARSLRWVLRHQPLVLAITLGTVCLAVFLYVAIPKGFFPQQDTGRINGNARASEDTSFQTMQEKLREYLLIIKADPAVRIVEGTISRANAAYISISLKPLSERKASVFEVINRLRPRLARVPGATLFMTPQQDVQIGGRSGNAQFQYTLQGDNLRDLLAFAPLVEERLRKVRQLQDVNSDLQNRALQAGLVIDRDTAGRLGLTPQTIDNALYDAFGQRQVSTMYKGLNQYHVVMEVAQKFQQSPDALKNIYIQSASGQEIPLSAFTHYEPSITSLAVAHQGQFPAITLTFNLAPNVTLGQAVIAVQNVVRTMVVPATIHPSFQGTAQVFEALSGHDALSDPGGLGYRLHRAGNSLRRLRSSDHDSLHASFGRRRRPAGAADLPHRTEHHRGHRNHPADRDREEERHPYDRRGHRDGTHRRTQPRTGHLSGVPAALQAHHDDHHGRDVWRPAHRSGRRKWFGISPPAGHRHRGGLDREPNADALHHSRGLSLYGSLARMAERRQGSAAVGRSARRKALGSRLTRSEAGGDLEEHRGVEGLVANRPCTPISSRRAKNKKEVENGVHPGPQAQ